MSTVVLTFDQRLFEAEAVQKAAYRGQVAFTIDIAIKGDIFECALSSNAAVEDSDFQKAVEDFKKDVIDYQLRAKLQAQTIGIRNLILGVAFSQTGLG